MFFDSLIISGVKGCPIPKIVKKRLKLAEVGSMQFFIQLVTHPYSDPAQYCLTFPIQRSQPEEPDHKYYLSRGSKYIYINDQMIVIEQREN